MDDIDKQLDEWNKAELEASKKNRTAIIMGRLWSIPKGYVILCQKYDFWGMKKLLPYAIGKLPNEPPKKTK